jgi:predicted Zn-dependent peptidase
VSQQHSLTQLASGLRVVTERIEEVRSIALGFWVRVGSRDEANSEAGISHFLEHMLFKGTPELTAEQIAQTFDGFGAELNASTSKESTILFAHFLDEHLERAFQVMSDMLLRTTYAELESEREVVLEEIAMYEDEPQDKVHDVLSTAIFGPHPLGRPVIGRGDVVGALTVDRVSQYHKARYLPDRIVVAAAGNLDHEQIVRLAERYLSMTAASTDGAAPGGGAPVAGTRLSFQQKDTEQYHICLGGMGIKRADERRFALGVLDAVFGGSSSSRLFQEVREKRGLAYSVYSWASQYLDSGQIGIYVGTREDNVAEAMATIASELRRIQEDVPARELDRAREQLKGRMALSMESTRARMNRLGSAMLMGVPLLTLDETFERIDAVTVQDVLGLASELYDSDGMSAAAVGTDEERFRRALDPINEQLAAA